MAINPNDKTLDLEWGGDFRVNQNGGLLLASGWTQVRQRILRRLLTNPRMTLADKTPVSADYIYHQDYGEGLLRKIGEPFNESVRRDMEAKIRKAVLSDEGVDTTRDPIIEISEKNHRVSVSVVVLLRTGRLGTIAFSYKN